MTELLRRLPLILILAAAATLPVLCAAPAGAQDGAQDDDGTDAPAEEPADDAPDPRAPLDITVEVPEASTVGDVMEWTVTLALADDAETDASAFPMLLDLRGVSFRIEGLADRDMVHHAYHGDWRPPGSQSYAIPREYEPIVIRAGEPAVATFQVPAVAAGTWTVTARHGMDISGRSLRSEPSTIEIAPAEVDGRTASTAGIRVATTLGDFTFALEPRSTPNTALFFGRYAAEDTLRGTPWHRISDQVIQGGDITRTDREDVDFTLPFEDSDRPHSIGSVGLARQGSQWSQGEQKLWEKGTGSTQFFVNWTEGPPTWRNEYCAFGRVVDGMEVVHMIAALPRERSEGETRSLTENPVDPPLIESLALVPIPDETEDGAGEDEGDGGGDDD